MHERSLSFHTPPSPANRLFPDDQPSSSSSYSQDSADFQPIRRQRTAVQRSAAPRPTMQHNAEKYIEDTFPLVDNFGHLWPEVTSPAREERRAQRSAAPPPVALRAPKAAAQGPPNIHSQTAGIGINFVVDSWDSLVIGSLVPGGPAERKGTLREGDVLISVDGLHLMGQRLVFDDVLNMVRGADGSDVILEFERPGKSERHKRP